MKYHNFSRAIARLVLLQRIELKKSRLKKIRKLFGRYIFTNFVSKFLIFPSEINLNYYSIMNEEYEKLKKIAEFSNKKILSIGSGMCGLELIINSKSNNTYFTIIEKDYVSKKVIYGWDEDNKEGYNNLDLLKTFLEDNGMLSNFEICNFDTDNLPIKKFDYIISLYSMDYHYNFDIYSEYIKKVSSEETKIIFDTIRPDYFKKIFHNVDVLSIDEKEIHNSKRIICNKFVN